MANRRDLKRKINNVMGILFADCLATKLYVENTNPMLADEILADILRSQNDFITRLSHTEPGSVKLFYKKFHSDFNTKVADLCDAIDKLGFVQQ